MTVSVETKDTFRAGRSRKLFDLSQGVNFSRYSVSPDGQRFLAVERGEAVERPQTTITVVQNWIKEFKDKQP